MKILWITNIVLPEASALLTGKEDMKGSGGWLLGSAKALLSLGDVQLFIATVSNNVDKLTRLQGKSVCYYLLPLGKGNIRYNPEYKRNWTIVRDEVKPDIVDIHGTEYSHGLAYIKACDSSNVVLTMQGVMSEISREYLGGLKFCDILPHITIHDILRGGLFQSFLINKRRAKIEDEYLSSVKYVIGRTAFDKAHTIGKFQSIQYFHCNETLRPEFYCGRWAYDNCKKHSIFISQASYPLKGLHVLLKALAIVRKKMPDVELSIAGSAFPPKNSLSLSGYQKYIYYLVKKYGLSENIKFVGSLSTDEMKKYLLKTNVVVCPSSCENSSNTISEAQILGIPVVASCVGGTPSLIPNNESGTMYPFNDYLQLAEILLQRFADSVDYDNSNVLRYAQTRHDEIANAKKLYSIYSAILSFIDKEHK